MENDLQQINQEIDECKSHLKILYAKRKQLKNPNGLTLTIEEAAIMLGVGRNAAYMAAKTGQIPTIKIGKRILVPVAAMEKMLKG